MYNFEVFNCDGEIVDRGQSKGHSPDVARDIVDRLENVEQIFDCQRDTQEPNCWSYELDTNLGGFTVQFK